LIFPELREELWAGVKAMGKEKGSKTYRQQCKIYSVGFHVTSENYQ